MTHVASPPACPHAFEVATLSSGLEWFEQSSAHSFIEYTIVAAPARALVDAQHARDKVSPAG
jgi:hypothetical protein